MADPCLSRASQPWLPMPATGGSPGWLAKPIGVGQAAPRISSRAAHRRREDRVAIACGSRCFGACVSPDRGCWECLWATPGRPPISGVKSVTVAQPVAGVPVVRESRSLTSCPSAVAHRLTVSVTEADVFDSYLCLRYEVTPIPRALIGDTELREGDRAGIAVDSRSGVCHQCSSAYRTSRTGSRVIGAVKVGPECWSEIRTLAVLFSPFAHTPALRGHLCEARLTLNAGSVGVTSVRAA